MNYIQQHLSKPSLVKESAVDDESLSLSSLNFLSPVHHHQQHHFHHASLHLCSTADSKLTFSINPSHHSLPHLFEWISQIFTTISRLKCSSVFSERELKFRFAICRRPSVCLSSVTFVRPTQAIEIFGNVLRHLVPWPSVTFV